MTTGLSGAAAMTQSRPYRTAGGVPRFCGWMATPSAGKPDRRGA